MTLDMKSDVWRRREFRAVERLFDPVVPGVDAAYARRRWSFGIFTFRDREGCRFSYMLTRVIIRTHSDNTEIGGIFRTVWSILIQLR